MMPACVAAADHTPPAGSSEVHATEKKVHKKVKKEPKKKRRKESESSPQKSQSWPTDVGV